MAHGTPERREEIEPFYTRIRRGRPPEPAQLAGLEGRYAAIGGVSPLAERTRAQVDALGAALSAARPGRYAVAFGAKHTEPFIEEAVSSLVATGVDRVVGLVLTPHGSSMGSEEYLERAGAALAQASASLRLVPVPPWYAEPGFVRLLAARVADAVRSVSGGGSGSGGSGPGAGASASGGSVHVFFTAHSLPARVRDAGDTYPEQLAESARLVAEAAGLRGSSWSVAWQSAGRTPEPWLGPDVRDEVRRLAADGVIEAVVVCPIGFVADHLEVLYDLDIELAAVAAECGLRYARTASLNDDPAFIQVLAGAVVTADKAAA
jgi:ferrochelatase